MQYIGEIYSITSDIGRRRLKEYSVIFEFFHFLIILFILALHMYLLNEDIK